MVISRNRADLPTVFHRHHVVTNSMSLGRPRLLKRVASFLVLYEKFNDTKAGNGDGARGISIRN